MLCAPRVGRRMRDQRSRLRHTVILAVKVYLIPKRFVLQLENAINFEKVELIHINSFSVDSTSNKSVIN